MNNPTGSVSMKITFAPSPDVAAVLNALLDRLENRLRRSIPLPADSALPARPVKVRLAGLDLPGYFSQTDPEPRWIANHQLDELARQDWLDLTWLPGETGHLLDSVTLIAPDSLYALLQREPLANRLTRLETLLLADRFRFPEGDWRARVVQFAVEQVRGGKSSSPFSLTDMDWNTDLLAVLVALPDLQMETPYRVFSVRTFNDSKRFESLKPALVRLARHAHPQWKRLSADELLRELNLVPNPTYIHFSGNWQFTTSSGEILSMGGFIPSMGFPAVQAASIHAVAVHADAVLCIENLTTFHEFSRGQTEQSPTFATLCTMGNPSPPVRRLLRLVPDGIPIYLWADMDYGGFSILSQLRQLVAPEVRPYNMDLATFDVCAHLSRPLTESDARRLRRLALRPEMRDVRPTIQHLLERKLKLEQEAI